MRLTKYNALTPEWGVGKVFDHFFNGGISDFIGSDFLVSNPSINIVETKDAYRLEVAAPGLEKEDFNLKVEKGFLQVSAERKEENEIEEEGKFTRREFNYTSFSRSFKLPETVDDNAINADYINGVLTVTLPKVEEEKMKIQKVIEVK